MMNKNVCLLVFILILFNSCGEHNNNELNKNDTIIFEKIIKELSGKEKIYAITTYVVNPYLNSFEFHPYFVKNASVDYTNKIQESVFKALKTDKPGFEKIRQKVNNKYSDEIYHSKLLDLSNSDSSNLIYTFSGLGENIVFVELRVLCDGMISTKDLTEKGVLNNRKRTELGSIAAIIDGNNILDLIPIDSSTQECF